MNIKETATNFGKAYKEASVAGTRKEKLRNELFDAFNEIVNDKLAQRIVEIDRQYDPKEYVTTHHPGYRIVEHKGTQSGKKLFLIEEDPAFKRHTYVNPDDQMVYSRTVAEGSPSLDDERLQEEDPEFWELISDWPEPWHTTIRQIVNIYSGLCCEDLKREVDMIFNKLQIKRILKPTNHLSPNQLAQLQKYMVPGQLQIRMEKPRKAKPEELGEE